MKSHRLLIALFAAVLVAAPLTLSAAPDGGTAPATKVAPATPTPAATPAAPKAEPKAAEPKAAEPAAPASAPAATTATATDDKPAEVAKPAAPEKQEWWQVLLAELLKIFLVIFVPVLSTLIVSLLRRWKINVEFAQVNDIATKAAGWAEQKALSALKEGKEKTSGGDKMKLALDFANGLANQYKLSSKATEKLQDLIESALGQEKVKAAATAEANGSKPEPAEPA
jgi:hypothetical protein